MARLFSGLRGAQDQYAHQRQQSSDEFRAVGAADHGIIDLNRSEKLRRYVTAS